MIDIILGVLYALVFAAAGLFNLVVGYYTLDALTPGRLAAHVRTSHSAARIAAAWQGSLGLIIAVAIYTNGRGLHFWSALGWSFFFGLAGTALLALAFIVIDAITDGDLGEELCVKSPEPLTHAPLSTVAAANIIAIGLIVTASIT